MNIIFNECFTSDFSSKIVQKFCIKLKADNNTCPNIKEHYIFPKRLCHIVFYGKKERTCQINNKT